MSLFLLGFYKHEFLNIHSQSLGGMEKWQENNILAGLITCENSTTPTARHQQPT